jgi:hypothetical protein
MAMKVALVLLFFTATISPSLFPQDDKASWQPDFGSLDVRREPTEWPTPEVLVSQLRSNDDHVRLGALRLMGLTDKAAYHSIWSQTSPSTVVGQKLLKPDDIRLMYAALGPDSTQQAVIAVLDKEGQMALAAVGVPTAKGWKRLAVFDCWCKYDMRSAEDALGQFIQLHPAPEFDPTWPQHFELVFHASGGGTGIYGQNEAHFRVRNGRLVPVLSFVSRRERGCETKTSCDHLEARWFYTSVVQDKPGGLLVTVEGDFNPMSAQKVDWEIRDLQNRYLRSAKCESYAWKETAFRYVAVGKSTRCPN